MQYPYPNGAVVIPDDDPVLSLHWWQRLQAMIFFHPKTELYPYLVPEENVVSSFSLVAVAQFV